MIASKHGERYRGTSTISADGKALYSWSGRQTTVYRVCDRRPYHADFAPNTSGGDVVAADRTSGNVLWGSALRAGGGRYLTAGTKYRVNPQARGEVVTVYGKESMGGTTRLWTPGTGGR